MVVSNINNNEGWGMGLLFFIFFHNNNTHFKTNSISLSSSSNLLVSKTQYTLSLCALLVFTTLLLFTLSTFQPTTSALHHHHNNINININIIKRTSYNVPALQGIGELFLRGSKPMSHLIVAHVSEDTSPKHLRTFIRLILHAGLLSRSDLVFVFPSPSASAQFRPLLKSDCNSLLRLLHLAAQLRMPELGSGLTRYLRPVGEGGKEVLWGRRGGGNWTSVGEATRPSYGSVVGFDASELDPEESLSGFLDDMTMRLRRWACYPMLLGRVRRNFKHVMLVDANNLLILSDPFSRVANRTSESVFMWSNSVLGSELTRRGRRNSGKEEMSRLNSGVVIGGSRGVRRFTNAALMEIVRVSIEHKGKNRNSVTESGVVNQLVQSGHLLKSINLITVTESIPESGSLAGFNSAESGSSFLGLSEYFSVVQRGQSGNFDMDEVVMREICLSHKLFTSVYTDCLATTIS